jgi:hypothetical protein
MPHGRAATPGVGIVGRDRRADGRRTVSVVPTAAEIDLADIGPFATTNDSQNKSIR